MGWTGLRAADVSVLPLKTFDICPRLAGRYIEYGLFSVGWHAGGLLKLARNLETLNIHMCSDAWVPTIPPLLRLKTLCITLSRLYEEDIEGLLSSCSSLQTFVYEVTSPAIEIANNIPDGSKHFQFSHIIRYLRPHQQTLTKLHMDLRNRYWSLSTEGRTKPLPPNSLKAFSKLEHLLLNSDEIYNGHQPWSHLDGQLLVKLLPVSIVSLHLTHHGWTPNALSSKKISQNPRPFCARLMHLGQSD